MRRVFSALMASLTRRPLSCDVCRIRRTVSNVVLALLATGVLALPLSAARASVTLGDDEYVVFYHHDALGSPVAATDEAGEVLWYEHTTPYGQSRGRLDATGQELDPDPFSLVEEEGRSRLAYTGHVRGGSTSLVYMQMRHYDPELGIFLSNDPVGFRAANPMSFHRYAYANNSPYEYVDPDGRQSVENESEDKAAEIDPDVQTLQNAKTNALNTVKQGMSLAGDVSTMAIGGGVVGGAKAGRGFLSWAKNLFSRGGPKGAAARLGIDLDNVELPRFCRHLNWSDTAPRGVPCPDQSNPSAGRAASSTTSSRPTLSRSCATASRWLTFPAILI